MRLVVYERKETGKNANRRLRKSGFIPAEIYGKGHNNVSVKVKFGDYFKYLHYTNNKRIMELEYQAEDGKSEVKAVLRKDVAIDPITKNIIHIDFYEFNANQPVRFNIPLHYEGQPIGVKQGGTFQHEYDEVEIECLPKDAVDFIEVDVSNLGIGGTIKISDLNIPKGVKVLEDENTVVASVTMAAEETEETSLEEDGISEPEVISKGKEKEEEV